MVWFGIGECRKRRHIVQFQDIECEMSNEKMSSGKWRE
jgi:hypothetical protein